MRQANLSPCKWPIAASCSVPTMSGCNLTPLGRRTPMPICRTISTAAVLCFLALPAMAQSPTLAELAAYNGPDRTARLIAGAKKEGAVNIYSSITVDDMKIISGGFEKKYGIKLQAWRASSESILQRALVEARGGRHEVDAIETSAAEMESLHRERMLQEIKSPRSEEHTSELQSRFG